MKKKVHNVLTALEDMTSLLFLSICAHTCCQTRNKTSCRDRTCRIRCAFKNALNFPSDNFLPPANEVSEGYVFTRVCLSTGGGIPACLAGLQGVVSQHALQVSRGWYPSMPCRSPEGVSRSTPRGMDLQAHTQGEVEGSGQVVSRPTARGRGLPGPHLGGWGCIPACTEAEPPPTDGYCHRQYTSCWNAFLLDNFSLLLPINEFVGR